MRRSVLFCVQVLMRSPAFAISVLACLAVAGCSSSKGVDDLMPRPSNEVTSSISRPGLRPCPPVRSPACRGSRAQEQPAAASEAAGNARTAGRDGGAGRALETQRGGAQGRDDLPAPLSRRQADQFRQDVAAATWRSTASTCRAGRARSTGRSCAARVRTSSTSRRPTAATTSIRCSGRTGMPPPAPA